MTLDCAGLSVLGGHAVGASAAAGQYAPAGHGAAAVPGAPKKPGRARHATTAAEPASELVLSGQAEADNPPGQ